MNNRKHSNDGTDVNERYNLRKRKHIDYTSEKIIKPLFIQRKKITIKKNDEPDMIQEKKFKRIKLVEVIDLDTLWDKFNTYCPANGTNKSDKKKDWVAATHVKNYLMKDPLIDWLELYYAQMGLGDDCKKSIISRNKSNSGTRNLTVKEEQKKLEILYEMGFKFEDSVVKSLEDDYPDSVVTIVTNYYDINHDAMNKTFEYMLKGVPIICQAPLYNDKNKTYGVADLLVRSDWMNKLFTIHPLDSNEEIITAPRLKGNYYYCVIDIKWTTMYLCAKGDMIRNCGRFLAYKGQLAIYNAALGLLQGYTPRKAYILAKSWKYTSKEVEYEGFNCFNRLGQIDFGGFDNAYIKSTSDAIDWVRNVRYNGDKWKCVPPSVTELYPNMCNFYDVPYHHVKNEIADRINELTQLWMVGPKNRKYAHENGIYSWKDPLCTTDMLGIFGPRISPVLQKIIEVNNSSVPILSPEIIKNNDYDWQNKSNVDFYVDFETINECFFEKTINLHNSKVESNLIFMIGVGYEEKKTWKYQSFCLNSLNHDEEERIIDEFKDFIEKRVTAQMKKEKITNRNLLFPRFFHWGNAEQSIIRVANTRHRNRWKDWIRSIFWIDFCEIFRDSSEPIVITGAKKFGLKEIAKTMYKNKWISSCWSDDGPSEGLSAMIDAIQYYKLLDNPKISKKSTEFKTSEKIFNSIINYNEIDCKVVWEIIKYLRTNHCEL